MTKTNLHQATTVRIMELKNDRKLVLAAMKDCSDKSHDGLSNLCRLISRSIRALEKELN